ncbi:MAG: hypothetical protein HY821_22595 [Acidobacteria bacterium]|nr:hypothetical protein [Acidobacteriota bacterium]
MATKKTTTKKMARKTAAKKSAGGSGAPAKAARPASAEQPPKKPAARQFSDKKLRAMLNMLLNQYADQVKEGGVKLTPSEGFRLMQLQETMGLIKPTGVKVEWVEPKE